MKRAERKFPAAGETGIPRFNKNRALQNEMPEPAAIRPKIENTAKKGGAGQPRKRWSSRWGIRWKHNFLEYYNDNPGNTQSDFVKFTGHEIERAQAAKAAKDAVREKLLKYDEKGGLRPTEKGVKCVKIWKLIKTQELDR